MGYVAPIGNAIEFDFTESGYTASTGGSVEFNFTEGLTIAPGLLTLRLIAGQAVVLPISVPINYVTVIPFDSGIVAPIPVYVAPPLAQLTLSALDPIVAAQLGVTVPQALIGLSGPVPGLRSVLPTPSICTLRFMPQSLSSLMGIVVPAGLFRVSPLTIMPLVSSLQIPLSMLAVSAFDPRYTWRIDPSIARVIYRFDLTGSPDGVDDVIIPVSSIQGRSRDGAPTYLSAVVPTMDYAAQISARPNGEMVLSRGYRLSDGQTTWQEISRAALDSVRIDQGSRNASVTLTGYATTTNPDPKTVTISGASYRSIGADGRRRYRCPVDMWLRPGDTALVHGESITVATISYTINPRTENMEIVE